MGGMGCAELVSEEKSCRVAVANETSGSDPEPGAGRKSASLPRRACTRFGERCRADDRRRGCMRVMAPAAGPSTHTTTHPIPPTHAATHASRSSSTAYRHWSVLFM